jgi:hypothetical protein
MEQVIDAIDIIINKNILSEEEIEFMNECKKSDNPIQFLQYNLYTQNKHALSIFYKLEQFENESK